MRFDALRCLSVSGLELFNIFDDLVHVLLVEISLVDLDSEHDLHLLVDLVDECRCCDGFV